MKLETVKIIKKLSRQAFQIPQEKREKEKRRYSRKMKHKQAWN